MQPRSKRIAYPMFACGLFLATALSHAASQDARLESQPTDSRSNRVDVMFQLLAAQQDLFHQNFIVFDDRDSGSEHFFPSGWMGDIIELRGDSADAIIHGNCDESPAAGMTCIKFAYPGSLRGELWAGVFWEYPENQALGPGYDLSRYKFPGESAVLKFSAKGDRGGEYAEFAFRNVVGPKTLELKSLKTNLSKRWSEYQIDVTDCLLTNVTGGFALSTKRSEDRKPRVIFIDNIRIEFGPRGSERRLAEPHFVRSYIPMKPADPDTYFRNSCFSYDNSLMVIAYCARGNPNDLQRARSICDAFVTAQERDPFADGRVRNGYSCGDLLDSLRGNVPRLPGWWSDREKRWSQESYSAGTDVGNMAWVAIGLLEYWKNAGKQPQYLQAATRICEWINRTYEGNGIPGYSGGVEMVATNTDHPKGQRSVTWKSSEHNIDVFVAFERLAQASGNPVWHDRAQLARRFVLEMRNQDAQLWTGTGLDGKTINYALNPLDVNPWALLAFQDSTLFSGAVAWAETNCLVLVNTAEGVLQGYDFKSKDFELKGLTPTDPSGVDEHGIWWEGTAQMQLAFQFLDKKKQADECLAWLRRQADRSVSEGAVIAVSTKKDGLATGFRRMDNDKTLWVYWKRPHIGGATCWYIFAELGWNPYWGVPVKRQ